MLSFHSFMKKLDELLGPSTKLQVLDLFFHNPEELLNLREIARRLDKNPGSIAPVLPLLVDRNYITHTKIGTKVIAYKLNNDNKTIQLLQQLLTQITE